MPYKDPAPGFCELRNGKPFLPYRCRSPRLRLHCCSLQSPAPFRCRDDVSQSFRADMALLDRFRGRCRFRFAPDFCPPSFLRQSDSSSGCSAHFPAFAGCSFRCDGGPVGASCEHRTEFGDLGINAELLGRKSVNCRLDEFFLQFHRQVCLSSYIIFTHFVGWLRLSDTQLISASALTVGLRSYQRAPVYALRCASNVGALWTRLVRGRHELDGDPVIADNGSGQVRPRCRATIQMTTNDQRNEDLWQHDRILHLRNGRKKWLAPKNDPTRPPNGWSGRKETPHQGQKSLPSKRRPSCVRKSGKVDKKPSGFPW